MDELALLEGRLNQLESKMIEEIKNTDHKFEFVKEMILAKLINIRHEFVTMLSKKEIKPYTCPVCDGQGKDKNKLVIVPLAFDGVINKLVQADCHSCEGKGVLWK